MFAQNHVLLLDPFVSFGAAIQSAGILPRFMSRDDFFAEKRIHGIPSLVHDFDGHDLKTLLHQMERHFLPILDTLSQEAGI